VPLRNHEPWSARIERELHAVPRQFTTVKGALLWWLEARSRREGRAIDLESAGAPQSQERADVVAATYARVARCLVERDREIDPVGAVLVTRDRLGLLVAWYASDRMQQRLADEAEVSLWEFHRTCRATERVLRVRMRARGVVA